jgi:hypothetical protein
MSKLFIMGFLRVGSSSFLSIKNLVVFDVTFDFYKEKTFQFTSVENFKVSYFDCA